MFNCSASVCSSATDFCFSSAISTDETPDRRARPDDRRAVGRSENARPGEVGRCMCDDGPRGSERAVRVVTGSFLPTQEAFNLERAGTPVKRGGVALRNSHSRIIFTPPAPTRRHVMTAQPYRSCARPPGPRPSRASPLRLSDQLIALHLSVAARTTAPGALGCSSSPGGRSAKRPRSSAAPRRRAVAVGARPRDHHCAPSTCRWSRITCPTPNASASCGTTCPIRSRPCWPRPSCCCSTSRRSIPTTVTSLREIEALAIRMRTMLREL